MNPYLLEYVPFERTQRAVALGGHVFDRHLLVYQRYFYDLFQHHCVTGTLPFDAFRAAYPRSLGVAELLLMGCTCSQLARLHRAFPATRFFDASCYDAMTRNWHVHVDTDCTYIPGCCGGISLGDVRTLDALCVKGIDVTDPPILDALVENVGRLYKFATEEFDYRPSPTGYLSRCHLCLDIRRCIAHRTDAYAELQPREFDRRL